MRRTLALNLQGIAVGRKPRRAQRDKAAQHLRVLLRQIILDRDGNAAGKIGGFRQHTKNRPHRLRLTDGGVGIRHHGARLLPPHLGVQSPGDGQHRLPRVIPADRTRRHIAPQKHPVVVLHGGKLQGLLHGQLLGKGGQLLTVRRLAAKLHPQRTLYMQLPCACHGAAGNKRAVHIQHRFAALQGHAGLRGKGLFLGGNALQPLQNGGALLNAAVC